MRPSRPFSGGLTSSPRSSASWRSRSSSPLPSFVGDLDHDGHEQVAATAAVDVGHAPARRRRTPAGLGAGRHDEILGAVERLELNSVPSAAWVKRYGSSWTRS